jgi:hypothetical protein
LLKKMNLKRIRSRLKRRKKAKRPVTLALPCASIRPLRFKTRSSMNAKRMWLQITLEAKSNLRWSKSQLSLARPKMKKFQYIPLRRNLVRLNL